MTRRRAPSRAPPEEGRAVHARRALHMPASMIAVNTAIYTAPRVVRADGLADDVRAVTGRPPVSLRDVATRERGTGPCR